mgnify:CR=1 FL=1
MTQEKKTVRAYLLNCNEITHDDLNALVDAILDKDSTVTKVECIGDARIKADLLFMESVVDIVDTIEAIKEYMKKMKASCIFCNSYLPAPIVRYMTASAIIYGRCDEPDDMYPVYEMWNGKVYHVGWFQG